MPHPRARVFAFPPSGLETDRLHRGDNPSPGRARQEFTVRAFAAREQVSPATVRAWIRKGAVTIRRTPGGGIRIVHDDGAA